MVTDLLVTVFDITFDHKTFHHIVDIFGNAAVFKHFLGNTDLLFKMFAGVCVVCIYDNSHIFKISLAVNLMEKKQVFVMVVWKAASVFVYASAKDRMRKRISLCLYFLLAVDEMVAALGCFDGIKHNRKVTAGWVFHTTWNLNSAGSQAVLLTMTQSAVSHQLRILRDARLVKSRKQGRVVYYSLDDDHIDHIFAMAFEHIMERMEG